MNVIELLRFSMRFATSGQFAHLFVFNIETPI